MRSNQKLNRSRETADVIRMFKDINEGRTSIFRWARHYEKKEEG